MPSALAMMDVDLQPHSGVVFVDSCPSAGRQLLTHTVTLEQRALPPGEWQVAMDPDGFAYLVDLDGDQSVEKDVDEILASQLAKSLVNGRRLIFQSQQVDSQGHRPFVYMDTAMVRFKAERFEFKVGAAMRPHAFETVVFTRPRAGFARFWCLTVLYSSLAFDMFSNTPSRSAWQSLPRFEKAVGATAKGQVLRSQIFEELGVGDRLEDRCLPWHGVSTVGLIVLLSQWAVCPTRRGGAEAAEAPGSSTIPSGCPF